MKDQIVEIYGDCTENGLLFADGLDDAIIGIEERTFRIVYSKKKVIDILTNELDGDRDAACEFANYNIFDAYVGELTPIWVEDDL